MKSINKILLTFIFSFLSVIMFNIKVNALVPIKESSNSFTGDVYVVASTKFDDDIVVTSARIAKADDDDDSLRIMQGFAANTEDANIYYYSELEEAWFLVSKEDKDLQIISDTAADVLEDSLYIFFVNNEEKVMEFDYDGDVNKSTISSSASISGAEVSYKDGKFFIPVTIVDVTFKNGVGKDIYITTDYDDNYGYDLGDFYISISITILDKDNNEITWIHGQTNKDGLITSGDMLMDDTSFSNPGYSLYYVDSDGNKIDFDTFVVTETTSIKQAWLPVGSIHTNSSIQDEEDITVHNGVISRDGNNNYVEVTVVAPSGYNTSNTRINGLPATFNNGEATINVPITAKGVITNITVEWENGVEKVFKVKAGDSSKFTYHITFYSRQGVAVYSEDVIEGRYISDPDEDTWDQYYDRGFSYKFTGWATNSLLNEMLDRSLPATKDLTLYPTYVYDNSGAIFLPEVP